VIHLGLMAVLAAFVFSPVVVFAQSDAAARPSHLLGAQEQIDKTCPIYTERDKAACYETRQATLHEAWVNCWEREEKPLQKTWGDIEGFRRALSCSCLVGKVPGDIFLRHGLYGTLREVGEVVATSQGHSAFGFKPGQLTDEQWSEMVRATINATRECRRLDDEKSAEEARRPAQDRSRER
jgi:hypothetical protein